VPVETVLTLRALNRATLARQHLLRRAARRRGRTGSWAGCWGSATRSETCEALAEEGAGLLRLAAPGALHEVRFDSGTGRG
jgi:hypothetical protein